MRYRKCVLFVILYQDSLVSLSLIGVINNQMNSLWGKIGDTLKSNYYHRDYHPQFCFGNPFLFSDSFQIL